MQHVRICTFSQSFLVNFCFCLSNCCCELLQSCLVADHWRFSQLFLLFSVCNLFFDNVKLVLLSLHHLFRVVMFFLDLSELGRHFINLICSVLVSGRVVCWVKDSVHLNKSVGSIVNSKQIYKYLNSNIENKRETYLNFFYMTLLLVLASCGILPPLVLYLNFLAQKVTYSLFLHLFYMYQISVTASI